MMPLRVRPFERVAAMSVRACRCRPSQSSARICARSYSVDGSLVGRKARCKNCGNCLRPDALRRVRRPGSGISDDPTSGPPPLLVVRDSAAREDRPLHHQGTSRRGAFGASTAPSTPPSTATSPSRSPTPTSSATTRPSSRFLREAKAAARLHHPHIVTVYEAGTDGDTSYIASAFIPGRSLADAIDDGPFDPRRAARIIAALADALHAAHEQGIVHRDVKPANVLLDDEDRPHLTDFGLARLAASSVKLTKVNSILGTPAYLSPEQARGKSDEADAGQRSVQPGRDALRAVVRRRCRSPARWRW